MITELAYELSILAKAVRHKNLSAAANQIGLSQPQLSRVIARIEENLGVLLLDRSARRKSAWTQLALDLAVVFFKGMSRLESEVLALAEEREITELHIGTLEGLSPMAREFAEKAFGSLKMKRIFLDVHEFEDLDSLFLSGSLDLIFTVRAPSKQKFQRVLEVGYQHSEKFAKDPETLVISPTDMNSYDKKDFEAFEHVLISNSLAIRKHWLTSIGGTGALPTTAQKGRGRGQYIVYLFGSDLLSPKIWTQITEL
jgi:DNA-binding transcriptional LysR family regulator